MTELGPEVLAAIGAGTVLPARNGQVVINGETYTVAKVEELAQLREMRDALALVPCLYHSTMFVNGCSECGKLDAFAALDELLDLRRMRYRARAIVAAPMPTSSNGAAAHAARRDAARMILGED